MAYRHVFQYHNSGCFVACVAMLLGKSYKQALKLIHPDKNPNTFWETISMPPEQSIERLPLLGIQTKTAKTRTIRHLRRDALLLIRWRVQPTLMHAVVYDAKHKKLLDPGNRIPMPSHVYERQLDTVLYIEKVAPVKGKRHANKRSHGVDSRI